MEQIVLASASPRRKELLHQVGIPFRIVTSHADETVDASLSPAELVRQLALRKANAVAQTLTAPSLVIGADTVVALGGQILGKPADEADAARMLRLLSGCVHQVYTGFALVRTEDGKTVTGFEKTDVSFSPLSQGEIEWYVTTKEPMDKAGAYGIQGFGAAFVEYIEGDYNNVVGLPVCRLLHVLKDEFSISFCEF